MDRNREALTPTLPARRRVSGCTRQELRHSNRLRRNLPVLAPRRRVGAPSGVVPGRGGIALFAGPFTPAAGLAKAALGGRDASLLRQRTHSHARVCAGQTNHSYASPDACSFNCRSDSRSWPCSEHQRTTARDSFPHWLGSLGPGRLVERGAYHPPLGRGRTPAAPDAPPRRATTLEWRLARVIAPALRRIADWPARDFAAVCG